MSARAAHGKRPWRRSRRPGRVAGAWRRPERLRDETGQAEGPPLPHHRRDAWARIRPRVEEARQALLDAAEAFVAVRPAAFVVIGTGPIDVIQARPTATPPEGLGEYAAAILPHLERRAADESADRSPSHRR